MVSIKNNMSDEEVVKTLLSNKDMTPCLLIGSNVNAFKREFSGTIERVYNVEGVRRLIEEYDNIKSVNSGFLAIEGIGYLSVAGQNSLLKFVEESSLPIVLLSYQDKIINPIRSRMKFVLKSWYPVKKLSFVGVQECQRALSEKKQQDPNFKGNLEIQYIANNCPKLYAMMEVAGDPYDYNNKRVLDILSVNLSKVKNI